MVSPLSDAIKLPCGLVLPNRLAKVCDHSPEGLVDKMINKTGCNGGNAGRLGP